MINRLLIDVLNYRLRNSTKFALVAALVASMY